MKSYYLIDDIAYSNIKLQVTSKTTRDMIRILPQENKAVNWIRINRRISCQSDILIPSIDFSIFFTGGHSLSGPKLEKNSNKTCFICSWKNKNSKWNPWKATFRWVLFPLQNIILLRTVKTKTWPFAFSLKRWKTRQSTTSRYQNANFID